MFTWANKVDAFVVTTPPLANHRYPDVCACKIAGERNRKVTLLVGICENRQCYSRLSAHVTRLLKNHDLSMVSPFWRRVACLAKRSGRPSMWHERWRKLARRINAVHENSETDIICRYWRRMVRKCHDTRPYKLQVVHALTNNDSALTNNDSVVRHQFCIDFHNKIEEDDSPAEKEIHSYKPTFHLSGRVNRLTVAYKTPTKSSSISGIHQRQTSFVPFREKRFMGLSSSRKTLQLYVLFQDVIMCHLQESSENFIFQQDEASPHWHREVRTFLSAKLSKWWTGRAAAVTVV